MTEPTPQGYLDAVNRIEFAHRETLTLKQALEDAKSAMRALEDELTAATREEAKAGGALATHPYKGFLGRSFHIGGGTMVSMYTDPNLIPEGWVRFEAADRIGAYAAVEEAS